jgi:hypothetical protein
MIYMIPCALSAPVIPSCPPPSPPLSDTSGAGKPYKLPHYKFSPLTFNPDDAQQRGRRMEIKKYALPSKAVVEKIIILNNSCLEHVPDDICQSRVREHLELNGNLIRAVPMQIGFLSCLRYLDLSRNFISIFPLELTNCTQLETLIFSDNPLRCIPAEISLLINLKTLCLKECLLTEMHIGYRTGLQELRIDHNYLTELPSGIGTLSQLQFLSASHNQIEDVPEELCQCTALKYLNLAENKLRTLPSNFVQLLNLNYLYLRSKSLAPLPKELGPFVVKIKNKDVDPSRGTF